MHLIIVNTGEIALHQQGKHVKRRSILSDPDVKEQCINWLRGQKPNQRSIASLRRYLRTVILPNVLDINDDSVEVGATTIVEDNTSPLSNDAISTYLKSWGFKYKKGI